MPCFIPRNFVFPPSSLLLRRKNHETQPNIFCSNRYSVAVSYFSVLCLAVLSLLTLGKSRDELQASNFAVQQTDLYYKTCEKATGTVTAIQKQLTSDYNQVSDPDAYFSLAGQIPDEIDGLAYDSSANVISFSEALSDTQKLSVKLKVLYPSSDTEPFIEILQWKTDNTASWTPDTHQPVYKGAQS